MLLNEWNCTAIEHERGKREVGGTNRRILLSFGSSLNSLLITLVSTAIAFRMKIIVI
jgi:hypothetical protein